MTEVHDSVSAVPDTGPSDIKVLLMTMCLRVARCAEQFEAGSRYSTRGLKPCN